VHASSQHEFIFLLEDPGSRGKQELPEKIWRTSGLDLFASPSIIMITVHRSSVSSLPSRRTHHCHCCYCCFQQLYTSLIYCLIHYRNCIMEQAYVSEGTEIDKVRPRCVGFIGPASFVSMVQANHFASSCCFHSCCCYYSILYIIPYLTP